MSDKAVLLNGDCLDILKELESNSLDSLVTDPPAFIEFMGRAWDGTDVLWKYLWSNNMYVKNVERFLNRMKVVNYTVGLNTAQENANTLSVSKKSDQLGDVLYASKRLTLVNPETKGSVDLIVLTKRELLELLSASLGRHTNLTEHLLSGDEETVSYVIPLILPKSERTNTVPNSVLTNIRKCSKSGKEIHLTSTAVALIRDSIEDRIGTRLEERLSNETNIRANVVKNPTSVEIYSVTTLSPTDSLEIIPSLTLLLSALVVTERSKNIQSYLASNFMECVMVECLRVLKPGAHGLVWAIPRTSHWTATALEDAGFEVRDIVTHLFGSGFPKSMDISKAFDKTEKNERPIVGYRDATKSVHGTGIPDKTGSHKYTGELRSNEPLGDNATNWKGWGTALKPASEHWILVRKPISEKTIAANVLVHGTGGINIDASRIGFQSEADKSPRDYANKTTSHNFHGQEWDASKKSGYTPDIQGRFPANLVLSHNPDCVEVGVKNIKAQGGAQGGSNIKTRNLGFGDTKGVRDYKVSLYNVDGTETIAAFECTPGCAVATLDEQSGVLKSGDVNPYKNNGGWKQTSEMKTGTFRGDSGGASRFFYVAKASKKDKGEGNVHPTVKSSTLMSHLIKLITPPGGIVLDPFLGSGSTGVSAIREGFMFVGIEKEKEYFDIASKRIGSV